MMMAKLFLIQKIPVIQCLPYAQVLRFIFTDIFFFNLYSAVSRISADRLRYTATIPIVCLGTKLLSPSGTASIILKFCIWASYR